MTGPIHLALSRTAFSGNDLSATGAPRSFADDEVDSSSQIDPKEHTHTHTHTHARDVLAS